MVPGLDWAGAGIWAGGGSVAWDIGTLVENCGVGVLTGGICAAGGGCVATGGADGGCAAGGGVDGAGGGVMEFVEPGDCPLSI
jgi:hypothetical protein